MQTRYVKLNGHDTRVHTLGDAGPAVIMLHGFPEYGGAWDEVMAALPNHRCFAPDQRGYGVSYQPRDIAQYATGRLARDVFGLIDALGLDRVHLVGHDWGAAVAYLAAFAQDPRIATLTILNGVHPIPFQRAIASGGAQCEASQYINWLRRPGSEDILAADNFARLAGFFAEGMDMSWLTGSRLDAYRAAWGDAERLGCMINWYRASQITVGAPGAPLPASAVPDLPEDRMHVTIPHLLIWGMGDTALLPEARSGLDRFCEALEIHEIADADHWLHHQQPARVAALIRDFIARHE